MSDFDTKCSRCGEPDWRGEHGAGICDHTLVDLAFCIGAECTREHGIRLATRRGFGPASSYILCDECFDKRLEPEAKASMREVRGVAWVRELGLHTLHGGRLQ